MKRFLIIGGSDAGIGLFGFDYGAAPAIVVGVPVEVPVMLPVLAIVNRSRGWYQRTGVSRSHS